MRCYDRERDSSGAAIAAEVLYSGRDPFTQKLFVDKGEQAGVQAGAGGDRRTRAWSARSRACSRYMAEVTLVTDKDHAVPVQVSAAALRSVMFGPDGPLAELSLRCRPNADIQQGDGW